jgi:hypothetical protein
MASASLGRKVSTKTSARPAKRRRSPCPGHLKVERDMQLVAALDQVAKAGAQVLDAEGGEAA